MLLELLRPRVVVLDEDDRPWCTFADDDVVEMRVELRVELRVAFGVSHDGGAKPPGPTVGRGSGIAAVDGAAVEGAAVDGGPVGEGVVGSGVDG